MDEVNYDDTYPSYEGAMRAAGAEILAFKEFGSYQGDWWAKVKFEDKLGWVHGSYGSCSGCDALQSEFDCGRGRCEDHEYDWKPDPRICPACTEANSKFQAKYAAFGLGYLDGIMSQKRAEEVASENLGWDLNVVEVLDFFKG